MLPTWSRLLPASHEDLGHKYKCDYYKKLKERVNNLSHQTLISQTVNVSSLLSGSVWACAAESPERQSAPSRKNHSITALLHWTTLQYCYSKACSRKILIRVLCGLIHILHDDIHRYCRHTCTGSSFYNHWSSSCCRCWMDSGRKIKLLISIVVSVSLSFASFPAWGAADAPLPLSWPEALSADL